MKHNQEKKEDVEAMLRQVRTLQKWQQRSFKAMFIIMTIMSFYALLDLYETYNQSTTK